MPNTSQEVNAVHCCGHLSSVATGILQGDVDFPVRGRFRFRIERRPNDRIGECAKLICENPYSEADMVLIQDFDEVDHWHGFIVIQGYHFRVRVQKDDRKMAITFFDVKQPKWGDGVLEVMNGAV